MEEPWRHGSLLVEGPSPPDGLRETCDEQKGGKKNPTKPAVRTFAERAAFSGDLDRVLAALLAGHCRAVRFGIHALAEGAVVLLPLFLVSPQFVVDPAAGLGAVHRQQLHIWENRRWDRMKEEEEEACSAVSPETRTQVVTLTFIAASSR